MSNRDKYVRQVMRALDTSDTLTTTDYIDALEELLSEVECRLDAAKESQ